MATLNPNEKCHALVCKEIFLEGKDGAGSRTSGAIYSWWNPIDFVFFNKVLRRSLKVYQVNSNKQLRQIFKLGSLQLNANLWPLETVCTTSLLTQLALCKNIGQGGKALASNLTTRVRIPDLVIFSSLKAWGRHGWSAPLHPAQPPRGPGGHPGGSGPGGSEEQAQEHLPVCRGLLRGPAEETERRSVDNHWSPSIWA